MKKFKITSYETLTRTSTYFVEASDREEAEEMCWDIEPEFSHEKNLDTDWDVKEIEND